MKEQLNCPCPESKMMLNGSTDTHTLKDTTVLVRLPAHSCKEASRSVVRSSVGRRWIMRIDLDVYETFNEKDWLEYRAAHPELRYWQALRAYMEIGYIWMSVEEGGLIDTFYIKDK